MAFSEVANDYLDFAKRRFVPKTYEKKVYVFKGFLRHAGDLPLNRVTVRAVESYLNTRSANTNYNRYRKELSALFNWAFKRQLMAQNPCIFIPTLPEPKFRKVIPAEEDIARVCLFQTSRKLASQSPRFLSLAMPSCQANYRPPSPDQPGHPAVGCKHS
jgi:site-specific recombinase XerD